MSRGLLVVWLIVTMLGSIGSVTAKPAPEPDPNLTQADITIVVVLAMEAHMARVCGREFDRDRWFERVMADRAAHHRPEPEIRAARKFWARYIEIFDVEADTRGVNVCSTEVSDGVDRALKRLQREFPE